MNKDDGYVTDVEYAPGVCLHQSPVHLGFACLLNGIEPVAPDRPFTYFELGFGQGMTVCALAASNPHGRFYGADFNPAHVAGARELAAQAGLDNLTLLENSFAELARGEAELPQFDFITMHGVYTWVSADNRRHVVEFIRRYLKPGGIVYSGYNAMPGWAPMLPLQRLWRDYGSLHPGSSADQLDWARAFGDALAANASRYVEANEAAIRPFIDYCQGADPRYVLHEYMNDAWQPLYFADVARDFAAARLEFAGSAYLPFAFPDRCLTPGQRQLLDAVPDPVWRETARDYLLNTSFRRDVFVRGARRLTPARRQAWMARAGLALTAVREFATLEPHLPLIGAVQLPPELYEPMLDALAERPRTLAELAALPALRDQGAPVTEMAAVLVASEQAAPFFTGHAGLDAEPARRLSGALVRQMPLEPAYAVLAAPLLGSAIVPGQVPRLVYRALSEGIAPADVEGVCAYVAGTVAREGHRIDYRDHVPAPGAERDALDGLVRMVLALRVPVWRQLGVAWAPERGTVAAADPTHA